MALFHSTLSRRLSVGFRTLDTSPLASATRETLHGLNPNDFAPALRNAVAARCLRSGRSAFIEARRASGNTVAEKATAHARGWMREYRRWRLD